MTELYPKDVEGMRSLRQWLEQRNERGLSECFDYSYIEHTERLVVRFPEGDLSNAPARLMAAIQGTDIYVDHLSVQPTASVILKER